MKLQPLRERKGSRGRQSTTIRGPNARGPQITLASHRVIKSVFLDIFVLEALLQRRIARDPGMKATGSSDESNKTHGLELCRPGFQVDCAKDHPRVVRGKHSWLSKYTENPSDHEDVRPL